MPHGFIVLVGGWGVGVRGVGSGMCRGSFPTLGRHGGNKIVVVQWDEEAKAKFKKCSYEQKSNHDPRKRQTINKAHKLR
jgi:hypothetical protein